MITDVAPSRRSPARVEFGPVLEVVGFGLLLWLLWRMFFAPLRTSFDELSVVVGLIGVGAATWLRRDLRSPIDGPLGVFVGLTLLSIFVHREGFTPGKPPELTLPPRPVAHVLALWVYFYGASYLLRVPRRLASVLTLIVIFTALIGVWAVSDHLQIGLAVRLMNYPSVAQWNGYAELGLVFATVFGLALAPLIASRSRSAALASAGVSLGLLLTLTSVYSRAAIACAFAIVAVMSAVELRKFRGHRFAIVALSGALVLAVLVMMSVLPASTIDGLMSGRSFDVERGQASSVRLAIWRRAFEIAWDHPWLGVGTGNYAEAMRNYVRSTDRAFYTGVYSAHAHNMLLHVAAESGFPAALSFLLVWWRLLTLLYRSCDRTFNGLLATAVFAALFTFFARCTVDHFLSGFFTSERMSFLLWTLFAAAAAIARARPTQPGLAV